MYVHRTNDCPSEQTFLIEIYERIYVVRELSLMGAKVSYAFYDTHQCWVKYYLV